jgi:primary-amine oxidase
MTATVDTGTHPLDPLTPDDITSAREVLQDAGKIADSTRFAMVQLREPAKVDVLAQRLVNREVAVVLLDSVSGTVHEALVDVTARQLTAFNQVATTEPPYGQPAITMEEITRVDQIVKSDAAWRQALAARGITDTSLCVVLPMAPGQFGRPDEVGRRMIRAFTLHRSEERDSPWAHPIEGLLALVDVIAGDVVRLDDHGALPIPHEHGNFSSGDHGPDRDGLKPLEITQPEGPSFEIDGQEVSWQNWRFRVGFDAREGLVLHQLSYLDRPVIYRASIAEMVVPYGDPHPARSWINYFDGGEYGLGRLATSLVNGCDCLGEIRYFDAALADDYGNPYVVPKVVCLHEEDHGILWKHSDIFTGVSEVRRSRRLAVSFFATIGNYDYGFYWYLYQDGSIELEAKLTGIMFVNAHPDGVSHPHSTQVAPGLVAPFHQHLFSARLDMTVDGPVNRVEEVDVVALPRSESNPLGNAITTQTMVIARESEAGRSTDSAVSRVWRIVNPEARNRFDNPTAYKLVPHSGPTLLAQPDSAVGQRATFATKHLWVTRYDPAERYPSGEYPNQHAGGAGIPAWVEADRDLDGQDVVLWHTFGSTHVTRPEDWPVMPVERIGFTLKPDGFFDRNPSLDVPPSHPACHAAGGDS